MSSPQKAGRSLKGMIPWWGKVAAKIVLHRLPISYAIWQRLGLFRHGRMDNADYVLGVFDSHVARSGLEGRMNGKTILELGPGDSVASALIAAAYGGRAILVDVGSYAKNDPSQYQLLIEQLNARGLSPPDISGCRTLSDLLTACGAKYLTDGPSSFGQINNASVDLVFSQAVLEHVRRHEFLSVQQECLRVLRPNGVCSHCVDLRDHLGGGLNNLRFSESVWESDFFVRSGFYTNRIQYEAMLGIFKQAGFIVEVSSIKRWEVLPIERTQLATPFRNIPDQQLNVSGFNVLLRVRDRTTGYADVSGVD